MRQDVRDRVSGSLFTAAARLHDEQSSEGIWEGELSTSALSTATAVMALTLAANSGADDGTFRGLIDRGLKWLAEHQNDDGGWGDTTLSISNISTTMLVQAVLHANRETRAHQQVMERADAFITDAGGVEAVIRRYGKDHTFSVPILTHCALAGTVDWKHVIPLPFELACVPSRFYAAVRLPVVSYALPALIAIGQAIFRHRPPRNPLLRLIRGSAVKRSLKVLESIQPPNGGFLEATPLTSFVCMSLLSCGHGTHPVTQKCLRFIVESVRPDGSWPIDTNLTTWVTTLSVNALAGSDVVAEGIAADHRNSIRQWLLNQQNRIVHPYTKSPPGGWSWTDLPGGVPDADDTPGAMLALMHLRDEADNFTEAEVSSLQQAAEWLLNLQNADGGWPTFCRGWGTLPFDRSSNDLTAHVLRALHAWQDRLEVDEVFRRRCQLAFERAIGYLSRTQASDGSWLPLWFGNQFHENDENPLYGTTKVVLALREIGLADHLCVKRGVEWLVQNQNDDGGWSAVKGLKSSVEETALALESLAGVSECTGTVESGVEWLCDRVEQGTFTEVSPIGFYFAKLWYFEKLYPIIFTVAALRRCESCDG